MVGKACIPIFFLSHSVRPTLCCSTTILHVDCLDMVQNIDIVLPIYRLKYLRLTMVHNTPAKQHRCGKLTVNIDGFPAALFGEESEGIYS